MSSFVTQHTNCFTTLARLTVPRIEHSLTFMYHKYQYGERHWWRAQWAYKDWVSRQTAGI